MSKELIEELNEQVLTYDEWAREKCIEKLAADRIEQLEAELKTERVLSFRTQLEQLEAERVLDEQRVADLMAQVADIAAERDELKATIYAATRHAAYLAIERCKNATGQRRQIELYVSANQCSEDACAAIDAAIANGHRND